jgi:cyclopropane-fatty-acyl-phospholipid synthase
VTQSIGSDALAPCRRLTESLFGKLIGEFGDGELVIDTPDGRSLALHGRRPGPQAHLVVHSWRMLGRLLLDWDIGFAESYMAGEWSSPNLVSLLTLVCQNSGIAGRLTLLRAPRFAMRLRHGLNRNTRSGSRRNIAAHYDLGNEFYAHWLDASLTYSAGLFSPAESTLEEAQAAKLDRVVDLLEIDDGNRVLEVGCGWGSLAERILERHDCSVTALTLSRNQLEHAQQRLAHHVARGSCDLRFQDYRDATGSFDRIVSIEMVEAVGAAYWPTYFAQLRDRLRPGGIAVLQAITIDERRFDKYRRRPDFIQKYIFPGGMLPTKSIIEREARRVSLKPVAQQFFGQSYARTLQHWNARFQRAWPRIQKLGYDERFKRMWDYYLAYCQVGFDVGASDVGFYKFAKR